MVWYAGQGSARGPPPLGWSYIEGLPCLEHMPRAYTPPDNTTEVRQVAIASTCPRRGKKGRGSCFGRRKRGFSDNGKGAIGIVDTILRVPSVAVILLTLKIKGFFAHHICLFTD